VTENRNNRGFTLLELMAVLAVITILAAVSAPKLYHLNDRNRLIEMVGDVEQVAGHARALAMQSSRAAVIEVNGNNIWVNVLAGPNCDDTYERRCVQNMGDSKTTAQTNVLQIDEQIFLDAGVTLCSIRFASVVPDPVNAATCTVEDVDPGGAFALCYAGNGELWVRKETDAAAACDQTGDPTVNNKWERGCAAWTKAGAAGGNDFSGAELRFSRFESTGSTCHLGSTASGELDVARAVHVPAGAHPFTRVEPTI